MKTILIENPDKLYFVSDPHFGHTNIIKYTERGFDSVEDMNRTLIANWNDTIGEDDTVFIGGDFCLGGTSEWVYFLSKLNGIKYLCEGNHDKGTPPMSYFKQVSTGWFNIRVKDPEVDGSEQRITVCHYPMLSWYQSHRGSWQLYGHTHRFTPKGVTANQLNICVENWDYAPISYLNVKINITRQHGRT